MSEPISTRRLIENEVVFRKSNERAQKLMQKRNSSKDGKEVSLHFYCECANEDCRDRVVLTPSRYQELHINRKRFVIKKGHDVKTIERVINNQSQYSVVEKYLKPPETAMKLQRTSL